MKRIASIWISLLILLSACNNMDKKASSPLSAADILGNKDYKAMAYGSFRTHSRDTIPSIDEIKEDLLLMEAIGVKIIRTYHTQIFGDTENLLKAIKELKSEKQGFEIYVMLGAWMECENAFTDQPIHLKGNEQKNAAELNAAIRLSSNYPDIVKIIAVGNEAMVHWAPYHVHPKIILEGVKRIKTARNDGIISKDIWITSSDNFASWGGQKEYHNQTLDSLIREVDYLSIHTYPFHDTHYNPEFWPLDNDSSSLELIHLAMDTAVNYAIGQYKLVSNYLKGKGHDKEIHIGETGWASIDNELYGQEGSKAADEYKQALYYENINAWCEANQISCFYFEAFDEPWKAKNPLGSENHFGLFKLNGEVKYALWKDFDKGAFANLKRNGTTLKKSYNGSKEELLKDILY